MSKVLAAMDEEDFLTGSPDLELDIDDIFAKPWDRVLAEAGQCDPGSLHPVGAAWPADANPLYKLQETEDGILLVAPDGTLAGGYIGTDLSLDLQHQGQGLGAEIVLARFLRFGDLPTWSLDTAAYSHAGAAAHRAAFRLGRSRPDLVASLQSMDGDAPIPCDEAAFPMR